MAHAGQLRSKKPSPTYAEARDEIRNIAPDDHWLSRYREPPECLVAKKVDAWLQTSYGVQLNAADNHDLDAVEEVRISNLQIVRNLPPPHTHLSWPGVGKAKVAAPGIWRQADKSATELRATLDKAGIFDFQILDETSLLEWTHILDVWPEEMPLSLEMVALGLTLADLDEEKRKAQEKAETVKREARIIPFNGHMIDPEGSRSTGACIGTVIASVEADAFNTANRSAESRAGTRKIDAWKNNKPGSNAVTA